VQNRVVCRPMVESLKQLAYALSLRLKSRARLEAENLVLRAQLNVLIRKLPKRLRLTNSDHLLLVWLYRLFPSILSVIRIVRPETVIRWHRRGFQAYWRWKSRPVSEIYAWFTEGFDTAALKDAKALLEEL
jgi:hypothetical protein